MKTQEEKYIDMRNKNQYDIAWFYEEYLQDTKDKSMSIEKFNMIFQSANFEAVLEHLDNKYKLDKIYDKENKLIKVCKGSN